MDQPVDTVTVIRMTNLPQNIGTYKPSLGTGLSRKRLWQMISANLPIGAYSYSTGLEYAVEAGWISSASDVMPWISAQIEHVHTYVDLPALVRLFRAWELDSEADIERWNAWLLANRETEELRSEELHQGRALVRLLANLGVPAAKAWASRQDASLANAFAMAAVSSEIPLEHLLEGYLWSWVENQMTACIKLVPLGQTQGQMLMWELAEVMDSACNQALQLDDESMGGGLPGVSLSSSLHETQYTRLFRS